VAGAARNVVVVVDGTPRRMSDGRPRETRGVNRDRSSSPDAAKTATQPVIQFGNALPSANRHEDPVVA